VEVRNKVQLITYPDSLGGNLAKLDQAIEVFFPRLFEGGVHILPPFPSSGDRGFAPLTYLEIDPRLGNWGDIKKIGQKHPVLLDMIVNHISCHSQYFQDYLQKGRRSEYADLFLPVEKFWPGGSPAPEDLEKIFLRRKKPFSQYRVQETGETKTLWTTFGKTTPSEQVDINIDSPVAQRLFAECLSNFSRNNVKIVRLDAVGYVVKKIGTSCFFVEPEIFQFLGWLKRLAVPLGIDLLPEVHAPYSTQLKLAEKGYWVYDFILPYLVLETFIFKDSRKLKEYLANHPHRQFTMLDCHDGIPVKPDLDGIYNVEQARKLVDVCLARGGNPSLIFSPNYRDPDGFDVHQIRGALYSLLGCDDSVYLAARAIQFFTPGIPQVYYVGLLVGKNDEEGFKRTGDGREINRHNYTIEEIGQEVTRPVVRKLIQLIQFRNSHLAFNGDFQVKDSTDQEIFLTWTRDNSYARLNIDLLANTFRITYKDASSSKEQTLD
jgi:sucrose 6(F)-phosphate phosphorylase